MAAGGCDATEVPAAVRDGVARRRSGIYREDWAPEWRRASALAVGGGAVPQGVWGHKQEAVDGRLQEATP